MKHDRVFVFTVEITTNGTTLYETRTVRACSLAVATIILNSILIIVYGAGAGRVKIGGDVKEIAR